MTHADIFNMFAVLFSGVVARHYIPQENEPNTIHIWLLLGGELIFTYNAMDNWRLETYEHYKGRAAAV